MKKILNFRLILFFLFFIFSTTLTFGQNTFKRFIAGGADNSAVSLNVLEKENSYFIFYTSAIIKLDSTGVIINLNLIKDFINQGSLLKDFVLSINDSLILFANMSGYNYNLVISIININNFNVVNTISLVNFDQRMATIKFGFGNKILASGGYLFAVSGGLPKFRPLITSINSSLFKEKDLRFSNRIGQARFCFETSDHHFIAGMTVDTVGACVAKIDTLGHVLWAKSYFRPRGMIHAALENLDGSYTLWGSIDSGTYHNVTQQLNYNSRNYLMKIDTSGQVIWCKLFGDSTYVFQSLFGAGNLISTNDGGYAITADCNNYMALIKTDAYGDTLWTRCHGARPVSTQGTSLQQTNDGGYILAGASNSTQYQYGGAYIVKTDSIGMTASHCQELNIPIPFTSITVNDSTIFLAIDTGFIQNGPSFMHDSAVAIPPNIDGCWLSGVGITEHEVKLNQIYSAIPNPSNGLFTLITNMENNDPITVLIYDILGHQVMPAKDFSGTEPTINLTSQSAGIYFLKIIYQNKVQVVKVLKE